MKAVNINPSNNYQSAEKIADSLHNLKEGVSELAGQVKSEAGETATALGAKGVELLREKYEQSRDEFSSSFGKVKSYVKNDPAKGIALAFAAGAIASILMRKSK